VADVLARQRETGIDLVNDGEFGHSMGMKYWLLTAPGRTGHKPAAGIGGVDDLHVFVELGHWPPRCQRNAAQAGWACATGSISAFSMARHQPCEREARDEQHWSNSTDLVGIVTVVGEHSEAIAQQVNRMNPSSLTAVDQVHLDLPRRAPAQSCNSTQSRHAYGQH
jgi:hypothetical protein